MEVLFFEESVDDYANERLYTKGGRVYRKKERNPNELKRKKRAFNSNMIVKN